MTGVPETIATTLSLEGGRKLAFAQYGVPQGIPVVFFQGTPSSRIIHPPESITIELGARVVVIDRPGFGRSDPNPGRTLLGWSTDVAAVLDHLGIGEFLAVGVSGGGPFVLAIAHAMPDRLRAAAVCGGSGPLDHADALKGAAPVRRAGYLLARYLPAVFRLVVARITGGKSPEAFAHWYTRHNPASDQAIISGVEFHSMYVANFAEALCQGPAAFADEVTLASRSWGFELEHVRIPVHFWHGELDNSTPIGMSRSMAVRVPSSELTILPGQGHLFVYGPQWRRILGELVAAGKSTTPSSTPK